MNALKKTLVGLGILVAGLIFIGFLLPSGIHVERSITISAAPKTVFSYVNDLKTFNEWSPWARIDPDIQYTFEGPPSGVGSKMIWSSENPAVGYGAQQITLSDPPRRVEVALDFGAQGMGTSYYELRAQGEGTNITWGFDSEFGYDLVGRYFGLIMDEMVGKEYDKGLQNLKELVESRVGL